MATKKQSSSHTIPALRVRQWLPEWDQIRWDPTHRQARPKREHFYVASMPATLLRRLAGIQQRKTERGQKRSEDIGIQRHRDEARSREIGEFVRFGFPWSDLSEEKRETNAFSDLQKPGWLPTAIVVNVPTPGAQRRDQTLRAADAVTIKDTANGNAQIILPSGATASNWKPKGLHPIEVIDGQHRLWAFDSESESNMDLPVVLFYDLDTSWQAYLFWTINIKPKKINPSLAFDLYPLLRSEEWLDRFSGHPIYRETRSQELVEQLWSYPKSPFYQRINMLGLRASQSEDKRPSATQNAWIRALMATYVKSWDGKHGTGGLFGSQQDAHEPVLPWHRAQQAAFLIFAWQCVCNAVRESRAEWAMDLRNAESPGASDPAFDGKHSLFTTDQGIRGVLSITNDLTYLDVPPESRSEINLTV